MEALFGLPAHKIKVLKDVYKRQRKDLEKFWNTLYAEESCVLVIWHMEGGQM